MGSRPGRTKTGGRAAGTPNKLTTAVKEALELCYESIGGDDRFAKWADENPGDFYGLWIKLLPRDFHLTATVQHTLTVERRVAILHLAQRVLPVPEAPADALPAGGKANGKAVPPVPALTQR
jgi:hypothetical protein